MKKVLVLLLCLVTMLALSACQIHIDTDPWPASPGYTDDVTAAPTHAVPFVTPVPDPLSPTAAPADEPSATDANQLAPIVTPTPQIDNEPVEPGFNG